MVGEAYQGPGFRVGHLSASIGKGARWFDDLQAANQEVIDRAGHP